MILSNYQYTIASLPRQMFHINDQLNPCIMGKHASTLYCPCKIFNRKACISANESKHINAKFFVHKVSVCLKVILAFTRQRYNLGKEGLHKFFINRLLSVVLYGKYNQIHLSCNDCFYLHLFSSFPIHPIRIINIFLYFFVFNVLQITNLIFHSYVLFTLQLFSDQNEYHISMIQN